MLVLKDVYGVEHQCTSLAMEVYFDLDKQHDNNSDYQPCFFIIGRDYNRPYDEFTVVRSLDYHAVADEFISLKKKLLESEPTLEDILSKQNKEVAAV